MRRLDCLLALTLGLGFATAALAETGIMTGDTALGKVLTDAKGMTLYTYDKDADGMSNCYDKCATNWPPLIAPADAKAEGDYGLTKRNDGSMQWTYDNMPLYLWVKDTAPGDTTGDGVGGVWHVVKAE
jgi:predicted lipoprotein with Yx(FWY)xxD motif